MNIWLAISRGTFQTLSLGVNSKAFFYMAGRMDRPKGMYASGMIDVHGWICGRDGDLGWDKLFTDVVACQDLRSGELRL